MQTVSGTTFTERLVTRQHVWWESSGSLADRIHRRHERGTFRSRDDPDEVWRCCRFWPRTVVNKFNGREFAARHGCEVPRLYWSGANGSRAPLESLPGRFVIRSVWGANREGVAVVCEGTELLHGYVASASELRSRMVRTGRLRLPIPILIEELIEPDESSARLPLELKCHAFAGRVVAVEAIRRSPAVGGRQQFARRRYYTPEWDPIPDPLDTRIVEDELRSPPSCLGHMLDLSAAMSERLGTYMRIDFFLGARGCVFNEFSSVPGLGRGYTPGGDRFFGGFWTEMCPHAV